MPNKRRPGVLGFFSTLLTSLQEWQSIRYSKKPRRMMLLFICIMNILLLLIASWVISAFAIHSDTGPSFFTAIYHTLTMILDAGCIESIISDPGSTNIFLIIFCLVVIVISMITFTGALIGYVTNLISSMIDGANTNSKRLEISGHLVILGWNNRASEIVNDLLYRPGKQKVVVLTEDGKDEIIREIDERLDDTLHRENEILKRSLRELSWIKRSFLYFRKRFKNNITHIVREGDVFSSIHLNNIQIKKAESVIILSTGSRRSTCPAAIPESYEEMLNGESRTIKTLIQVIDLTSGFSSSDNQKIVVEVENDWIEELVETIIQAKQKLGKCRVVPFRVHRVMGQLLSQFSLMPALNEAYRDLFSNKGATIYAARQKRSNNSPDYIDRYLANHCSAIPLTFMKDDLESQDYFYFVGDDESSINISGEPKTRQCPVDLNPNYWISEKHVLILGSNSKIQNVMTGFQSFCDEWEDKNNPMHSHILHVTVMDEKANLKRFNYYEEYHFVEKRIPVEISEQKKIKEEITSFINQYPHDSSILILSDDSALDEDIDSKALTYLIDAKDTINRVKAKKMDVNFTIDIVVEIIDPKHYDILKSYDVHNVVISNRYISKMITQISENYALYYFYKDIMTYDDGNSSSFMSKEVYIKKAGDYFSVLPPANTPVDALIRTVFAKSRRFWGHKEDFAILIGYVDTRSKMHIFSGDQRKQTVSLTAEDQLIIYSNH